MRVEPLKYNFDIQRGWLRASTERVLVTDPTFNMWLLLYNVSPVRAVVEEILVCSDGSQPEILQGLNRRGGELVFFFLCCIFLCWKVLCFIPGLISLSPQASDLDGEIDLSTCCNVTEYQAQRNYGFQIHVRGFISSCFYHECSFIPPFILFICCHWVTKTTVCIHCSAVVSVLFCCITVWGFSFLLYENEVNVITEISVSINTQYNKQPQMYHLFVNIETTQVVVISHISTCKYMLLIEWSFYNMVNIPEDLWRCRLWVK